MDDRTMKAKHRLMKPCRIEKKRQEVITRLARVKAELEEPDTSYLSSVNVKQSRRIDRLQELTEIKQELQTQIDDLTISELEELNIIGDMIDSMQNNLYSRLLTLRYISGKDNKAIADLLGYSYGYIRKSHTDALRSFYDLFLKV